MSLVNSPRHISMPITPTAMPKLQALESLIKQWSFPAYALSAKHPKTMIDTNWDLKKTKSKPSHVQATDSC